MLGVESTAGTKAIEKAYKKLAPKTHPDKHEEATKNAATTWFKAVTDAKETLTDPARREAYEAEMGLSTLPAGWMLATSKTTGRHYYWLRTVGHAQLEDPRDGMVYTEGCDHCTAAKKK